MWSIGYHQSRCSYYPQEKVEWIASTFRKKKIPLDCIVLDADYQLGYQPFRVNKDRFPDMPALATNLAKMNIELTASVYPGVKIDSTYASYTDGLKKEVFIEGVMQSQKPGGLLHHAFSARSLALFEKLNPAQSSSYISGLLIGEEIKSAKDERSKKLENHAPLFILGNGQLTQRYSFAKIGRAHV